MTEQRDEGQWPRGFDGHEEAQRRRLARMPFTEKLRWLEEADRLVRHLTTKADVRGPSSDETPTAGFRRPKPGGLARSR
jgi:hypothetical protein